MAKPSSATPGYLLKEVVLIIAFCYLVFFANTWRLLADYEYIRFGVAALTLTSIAWLVYGFWSKRGSQPSMPLVGPFTFFLAVYLLGALTSRDPHRSFDEVWVTGMYAFIFFLAARLVRAGWPRELFVKALLIAGFLIVGLAWWVALGWYRTWLDVAPGVWLPEIAYRLPLANGLATFFNLLFLSALARFLETQARLPRLLLAGLGIISLGLIFLTVSRGGWLGFFAGLATLFVLKVHDAGVLSFLRSLWDRLKARPALTMAILIVAVAGSAVVAWLAVRQLDSPVKGPALVARAEFWIPAWNAFLESPLIGRGPFTFGSIYLLGNSVPPSAFYPHAHSIFFNLLAETGLAGVAAFAVLAVSAFRALWRQVSVLRGEDRTVALGALAGAMAFAAHSLVDTVQVEPVNAVTFAVILGIALAPGEKAEQAVERSNRRSTVFARSPILLGLILSVTGFYNVWRLTPLHNAVKASQQGSWKEAEELLEEAVRRDSGSAIAWQQLGLAKSILAAQGQPEALEQATAAFTEAAKLDPDWWLNHANLAALHESQNNYESALAEMQIAASLAPRSAFVHLNLGVAAEGASEWSAAGQAYHDALNLRPDWAEAYFWRATSFRQQALVEWRRTATIVPAPALAELEAVAQGADRASAYVRLAGTYVALGRLEEAERLLKKASLAYFAAGEERLEMLWVESELAAARGDLRAAAAKGEQAVSEYQLQSAFGPGAFGEAVYGLNVFRQETMAVDLAPQLTPAPFTDRWAGRMLQVGEWYKMMDDEERATSLSQKLLKLVPDNIEAQAHLQE